MDLLFIKLKEFGRVRQNEPLSKHTTFKIGGPARFFLTVENNENLIKAVSYFNEEGIKYFILGAGSNVLFSDDGFDGVVLKIAGGHIIIEGREITADVGAMLSEISQVAVNHCLTGFEWVVGIPGSLGGAIRGNAGAMGSDMSKVIKWVDVWRDNEILRLTKTYCSFSYRHSIFKTNFDVILRACLELNVGDKSDILKTTQTYYLQRCSRVSRIASAGCFFKNVSKDVFANNDSILEKFDKLNKIPAGWLIEQSGCVGLRFGDACLSAEHNNIIINSDKATQSDVLKLVAEISDRVYNKFGVTLELEVQVIG